MTTSPAFERTRLILVLTVATTVLLGAEWAASRIVNAPVAELAVASQRAGNVVVLPKNAANLPPPPADPLVLLLGNSHTYALPGLRPGEPLRNVANKVLLDEIAARVAARHPDLQARYELLAYPNFLPYEMLTSVGHLLADGYRPRLVILGLTWRNIARDSQLRHEIRAAYREPQFAPALAEMLQQTAVHAPVDLLEAVATEQRRIDREAEVARLRSDADRLDESLTQAVGEHLTLLGRSADLRSRLYRDVTVRAQGLLTNERQGSFSYELVEHNYRFNWACLEALLRMLRAAGAEVVCYYAPERSDLPALMDPRKQAEFTARFDDLARELGVLVIDARSCVPNEYWGWEGDAPDRSHFTEPGHQALAELLTAELEAHHLWTKLAP